MPWPLIIELVAKYGLPFAEKMWSKWSSNSIPTQADFDELRALASQTAQDRIRLALVRAGIPLDSPQALSLLAAA
jgi:hypothetical protein